MLQPVLLRGAGGHSRQWAELCSFPFKLFILPDSALFFYHFLPRLSSLLSFSLSLLPSAWPHRRWQPKSLISTRCTVICFPPILLFTLFCSCTSTHSNWTICVCAHGQERGSRRWFLQWFIKEWKKTADTQADNKRNPKTPNHCYKDFSIGLPLTSKFDLISKLIKYELKIFSG